ncbi:MAG: FCD domain-containing protein [Sphingobium sp.]
MPKNDLDLNEAVELGGSIVARTVRQLTQLSLQARDGDYLGSEADLLERMSISRPTLRQAAKVVQSDCLLSIRRGVNGGFFATRPSARHVVQAPALWLRLHDATLDQMNRASMLIYPTAGADAAKCTDPALVAELTAFRAAIAERERRGESQREILDAEIYLSQLIANMSGDPVLILFIAISYTFGLLEREHRFYRRSPERRKRWLELQRSYCDAILSGDSEIALVMGQRRGRQVESWIAEDSMTRENEATIAEDGDDGGSDAAGRHGPSGA